jgi:ABC-type nitrate/sulfonate/bicarbonate transport system substrate-binding protein
VNTPTASSNRCDRARRGRAGSGLFVALILLASACAPAASPPAGSTTTANAPAPSAANAHPATGERPSPPAAPTPPPTRLALAVGAAGGATLPLWVGLEAGLFEQRGVLVDAQVLAGTRSVQALAAGEVQAATGDALGVASAVLNGLDLAVIATVVPTLLYKIMVRPSITGPEGLRSARFGITTRGSSTDYTAHQVLARWGLDADRDVTLLELRDQAGILAGLQGGSVDAVVMGSPTQQMAARLGYQSLLSVADLNVEYGLSTISAQRPAIAAQRDLYLRFLEGYVAGIQRMKSDRAFTLDVAARVNKLDERDLLDDYYATFAPHTASYPRTPPGAIQAALDLLAAALPGARDLRPEAIIDNSLLDELQAAGRLPPGSQ